ncbi:Uncharacterized protein Fot_35968 [Forsythia ovata]|uniref:Uncharacterized protein n=1 Tax=Forsythia ovata TaxID=205694 RepID=A0ABD1SN29_9LAMI
MVHIGGHMEHLEPLGEKMNGRDGKRLSIKALRGSCGSSKTEGIKDETSEMKGGSWDFRSCKFWRGDPISPRTHMVNLGLTHEEMDRVVGWVEHVREMSGGHEDPKPDPEYWA